MKKIICILLALLLLAGLSCTAFAAQEGVQPGDSMPDFTVALSDGTSATLSELLKGNDLVVLNVFATWCGPCKLEFPEMEKTYQAHSDRMVILSVSGDPADTREMIAAYKEENALSFPMGMAGDALDFLDVTAYPTTVFIDRDGKVGFYKVGSFVQEGDFEAKVNTHLPLRRLRREAAGIGNCLRHLPDHSAGRGRTRRHSRYPSRDRKVVPLPQGRQARLAQHHPDPEHVSGVCHWLERLGRPSLSALRSGGIRDL